MNLEDLVRISDDNLVPAFVMVGDLVPVAQGGRKGASFFYDHDIQNHLISVARESSMLSSNKKFLDLEKQFSKSYLTIGDLFDENLSKLPISTPHNELMRELKECYEKLQNLEIAKIYERIASEMSLKTILFPYLTQYHPEKKTIDAIPRFYILDREPNVNDMIESNVKTGTTLNQDFIFMDGKIHDYAYCCVKAFSEARDIENIDNKKALKCTLPELFKKFTDRARVLNGGLFLEMNAVEPEENVYQFYSEEFFPHSMLYHGHCRESIEKGKSVYRSITSVVPKRIANDYFYLNLSLIPVLNFGYSGYSQVEHTRLFRKPFSSFVEYYKSKNLI